MIPPFDFYLLGVPVGIAAGLFIATAPEHVPTEDDPIYTFNCPTPRGIFLGILFGGLFSWFLVFLPVAFYACLLATRLNKYMGPAFYKWWSTPICKTKVGE